MKTIDVKTNLSINNNHVFLQNRLLVKTIKNSFNKILKESYEQNINYRMYIWAKNFIFFLSLYPDNKICRNTVVGISQTIIFISILYGVVIFKTTLLI